jgi:polyisoprenoid-binding protein YceI
MPLFRVDSRRSRVDIELRVNLHPSHITAGGITGTIQCELDDHGRPRLDRPYSAELVLPLDSITSGNGLQDREMRRRFEVSRFPDITARVTRGERVDGERGRYRAAAQLSMHGRTREVTGEVELRIDGETMTVDGDQVINVKEFGIDPPRLLILRVEPDVDIRAHIVARTVRTRVGHA